MEKGKNQISVKIWSITFHNDDPINAHLDNTGKILFALKPKYPLNYVVYPISESNSSTPSNLLIRLKRNR